MKNVSFPLFLLLLSCFIVFQPSLLLCQSVPTLSARVVDLAEILEQSQEATLVNTLTEFEKKTGSQIVVLTVASLQGSSIEQFSIEVAENWKIGRTGVDDGILLLVAPKERKTRIEVGRGLEGAVPDVLAYRIIQEYMIPAFKQGNYDQGVIEAVNALISLIEGEALPPPKVRQNDFSSNSVTLLLVGFMFFSLILAEVSERFIGRFLGRFLVGLSSSFIVFFLSGLALAVFTFFIIIFFSIGRGRRGRYPRYGGGFSIGGGSFGSGSFGGGGGSFSGGGASGSW